MEAMTGESPHVQLQTAVGSADAADAIADALLEARLAACVQVLGPVRSRYRWRGRIASADEWLCLVKTTLAATGAAMDEIARVHSYETPEIIVLPIVAGHPSYLAWIDEEVSGPGHGGAEEPQP